MSRTSKLMKSIRQNRVLVPSVLLVSLVFALSIASGPKAINGPKVTGSGAIAFAMTVDSSLAKPGDRINFTLSYLSGLDETAYNLTVYEWMPSELTLVTSRPFYDGASEAESGFYRWSRGNVLPSGTGTITVSVLVSNIPVGTEITNTAHLAYELENGTQVKAVASVTITVTQVAGVNIFPDQIHSVAPHTGAQSEYNVSLRNTGNALDTFDVALRSLAFSPSSSAHEWTIELFDSTGYFTSHPVATVHDENSNNRAAWTDHGVVAHVALEMDESTWFILRVTEAEGTSGSGDAFLDVQLTARSQFDPTASDMTDQITIVRSVAGITFAPDYTKEANPGSTVTFSHIIVNSGQSDVIDLNAVSPLGWTYSFFYDNGTPLTDTDGSGYVDVGLVPKNQYVYILVKMTVPYNTPAGTVDAAVLTATGVVNENLDTVNDTTTVRSAPIVGISKTLVSSNPAYEGDAVTYKIQIVNLGNTKLVTVPLDDTFETRCLDFASAQPIQSTYDEVAGNIHWDTLGPLEPGQSVNVTLSFVATAGGQSVRESSNVIDAEDEFGNLISATCVNRDLNLVGAYTLTVTASPAEAAGGAFKAAWTHHGAAKEATFATPQTITCDEDTTVVVSDPETPIDKGTVRHVFEDYWPAAVVSMDTDTTVTLNYRTEYVLTFDQTGSDQPIYVMVDGIQLAEALPQDLWIAQGSTVLFSYPSPVTDAAGTTRYVLTSIEGNATATSVTVNAPTVVTGHYKTQYYLSVTTDPEGLYDPQYSGWYDAGTAVNLAAPTLVAVSDGVQYRFDQWVVEATRFSESQVSITVNAPLTATAKFVQQFRLIVVSSHGSPAPAVGEHWFDTGTIVSAYISTPADENAGTRYRCLGWTGTGSVPEKEYRMSASFTITAPSAIEWIWMRQYYLTLTTDPAGLSQPTGQGWYDEGTYAPISVGTLAGGDGATMRYRFDHWVGAGVVQATDAATTIKVDAPKSASAAFVQQFYLTMATNYGEVTPQSSWYDVGSTVIIEAFAPTIVEGDGYVWRGWTGTGDASYSGVSNPASVVINEAITETAMWKVDPVVTLAISSETVAYGDRIVVYGATSPAQPDLPITVFYRSPSGTAYQHTVSTDATGAFTDTLILSQYDLYPLLLESGEWSVTALQLEDVGHESAQASTSLRVDSQSMVQFPPLLLAGAILVAGVIAYAYPASKKKNGNGWRRVAVALSIGGLILGACSLLLNWVIVTGTVASNGMVYQVDVQLYPLSQGMVSISDELAYIGPQVSAMVQMSSGPVLSLYLIPAACVAALIGVYKPKSTRQRNLKIVVLAAAGTLIAASVIHTHLFVQLHASTIGGAGIGYGVALYVAIMSFGLTLVSALFTSRENNGFAERQWSFAGKMRTAFSRARAFITRE